MSEVVEGVVIGEGSVLSMGMLITQSTKIVNAINWRNNLWKNSAIFSCSARISA